MNLATEFIESGILEMYVLGQATADEVAEVERMSALFEEVRNEIMAINDALESYARSHAMQPEPTIEPFLMATIDYMERMKAGEAPGFPPVIHMGSSVADYEEWLSRPDLQLAEPLEEIQAKIIGYTPEVLTAIIWLKNGAPPETHTNELEQFLIVEGTCDIVVEGNVQKMSPGDALIIPLHMSHYVRVTSDIPCKIILQRVAA